MSSSIAKIVEIIKIPHGINIPESVRAAWVGCVLPCASTTCGHIPVYTRRVAEPKRKGLMSAKEALARDCTDDQISGFDVDQAIALQVLAVHSPQAAQWFYDRGYPSHEKDWPNFGFKNSEVKVLKTFAYDELRALSPR